MMPARSGRLVGLSVPVTYQAFLRRFLVVLFPAPAVFARGAFFALAFFPALTLAAAARFALAPFLALDPAAAGLFAPAFSLALAALALLAAAFLALAFLPSGGSVTNETIFARASSKFFG